MNRAYVILILGFLVVVATAGAFAFHLYQKIAGAS